MREFYRFIYAHKKVAVALDKKHGDNVKVIETWPIINAYAVDGLGGGFFTLRHKVSNIREDLNSEIYANFDKHSKLYFLKVFSKKLMNNFSQIVSQISTTEQKRKGALNQAELGSAISETFDLVEMSRATPVQMSLPFPSISFGVFTSQKLYYKKKEEQKTLRYDLLKQVSALTQPSSIITQSSHVEDKGSLHMVIENVEAIGMIRNARTYFLTSNAPKISKMIPVENCAGYVDDYEIQVEKDSLFLDEYKLTSCYLKLLQTYLKFIKNLHHNLNKTIIVKVQSAIAKKIQLLNSKLKKGHYDTNESVNIEIKLYNQLGEEFDFFVQEETLNYSQFLVVVRIEVSDIQSVVFPDKTMGSIVVADSFLFLENQFINLTRDIPYFDFFECRAEYSQSIRQTKEIYAQKLLGERKAKQCGVLSIYIPFTDQLDSSVIDNQLAQANASWFEDSLKIHSEKFGCFMLRNKDIVSAEFYRSLHRPWAIFYLKENIFFPKLSKPIFCLRFEGQAVNDIYIDLKGHLDSQGIMTSDIFEYPAFMKKSLTLRTVGLEIEDNNKPEEEEAQTNTLPHYITDDKVFTDLLHYNQEYNILSKKKGYLSSANLSVLIKDVSNDKHNGYVEADPNKVEVLLMVGPLGQGKRQLMDSIDEIKKSFPVDSNAEFSVITYTEENMIELDTEAFITLVEDSIGDREGQLKPGKSWILMVAPHTMDHLQLIRHIEASDKMRIRNVFTKIVLNEVYTKNRNPIQNLAFFYEPGFTMYCFADSENVAPGLVFSKMTLLRDAYPHIKFVKIKENKINYHKLSGMVMSKAFQAKKNQLLRSFNKDSYIFPYEYMFLNYRLPLKEPRLEYLRKMISDYEGVLLQEEQKVIATETAEAKQLRTRNLGRYVKNSLKDVLKEFMKLMRGVLSLKSGKSVRIHRIKGLMRYEDKISEGVHSLYLSPFAEWIDNFEISTEVEIVTKDDLILEKPKYEEFSVDELGFYIYGNNLDRKTLIKIFNKSMITQIKLNKIRTRANLTLKEIEDAEYQKRDYGLNGDFVHDGNFFRDRQGVILQGHPLREEILSEFIKKQNKILREENEHTKNNERLRRKFYQAH